MNPVWQGASVLFLWFDLVREIPNLGHECVARYARLGQSAKGTSP